MCEGTVVVLFPAPIVNETLKRFNVPQDKWAGITKSLSNKDKEVVKIVEGKAAGMNPNPLKDPQQRQGAVKLFRETLLQVFTDALKENGLTDTDKFQAMLDDIQQQKAKKFAMCMEKQKQKLQEQDKAASSASDSDEENDDENNDENDENDDENDDDVDDESNDDANNNKDGKGSDKDNDKDNDDDNDDDDDDETDESDDESDKDASKAAPAAAPSGKNQPVKK